MYICIYVYVYIYIKKDSVNSFSQRSKIKFVRIIKQNWESIIRKIPRRNTLGPSAMPGEKLGLVFLLWYLSPSFRHARKEGKASGTFLIYRKIGTLP